MSGLVRNKRRRHRAALCFTESTVSLKKGSGISTCGLIENLQVHPECPLYVHNPYFINNKRRNCNIFLSKKCCYLKLRDLNQNYALTFSTYLSENKVQGGAGGGGGGRGN